MSTASLAPPSLAEEISRLIIETLDLEDLSSDDIDPEAPLFGDGLGLDSIDALELGVALQKRFGISLEGRADEVKEHFRSVRTLAEFVHQHARR